MTKHQLKIFSFHVELLTTEPVGSEFHLSMAPGHRVFVWIKDENSVFMERKNVGDRHGARHYYVDSVADALGME
jgi:hypothetical protein